MGKGIDCPDGTRYATHLEKKEKRRLMHGGGGKEKGCWGPKGGNILSGRQGDRLTERRHQGGEGNVTVQSQTVGGGDRSQDANSSEETGRWEEGGG